MVAAEGQSRPGGKLGQVLIALEAARGATLAELTDLTGWLPHTTRGPDFLRRRFNYCCGTRNRSTVPLVAPGPPRAFVI